MAKACPRNQASSRYSLPDWQCYSIFTIFQHIQSFLKRFLLAAWRTPWTNRGKSVAGSRRGVVGDGRWEGDSWVSLRPGKTGPASDVGPRWGEGLQPIWRIAFPVSIPRRYRKRIAGKSLSSMEVHLWWKGCQPIRLHAQLHRNQDTRQHVS